MDIELKINNVKLDINSKKLHKMLFLFNALENGWTIKKRDKNYIFVKNHEGKREIFDEEYLSTFVNQNSDASTLFF